MEKKLKTLRCYAKKRDGVWMAFCIDLTLAAQGKTLHEAKRKLHAQILDYVHEALTVDRAHIAQLLNRKAPLLSRIEYQYVRLLAAVGNVKDGIYRLFEEKIPSYA